VITRGAVALVILAACGGGGDDTGDDTGDDDPGDLVGRIEIEEAELGTIGMSSSISAAFIAPDEPDLVNDGTCRVFPYPCLGQVGACLSPEPHSAGTIEITGLASTVTLVPDPELHGYAAPGGLPDELFADTAVISATAAGDEVGPFSLDVAAVTPMVSGYVDAILGLEPGQPLELTWTTAPGPDTASIELRVNWADVCHAGAEWYVLVCEVVDTGAFTVPAAITSALPAGFGHCGARLARLRRSTAADPRVELVVRSSDYFGFL